MELGQVPLRWGSRRRAPEGALGNGICTVVALEGPQLSSEDVVGSHPRRHTL